MVWVAAVPWFQEAKTYWVLPPTIWVPAAMVWMVPGVHCMRQGEGQARARFMRTTASLLCIAERYIKDSAGKSLCGRASAEGLSGKRVCDTIAKDENTLWLFCLLDNLRHSGSLLHGPGVQGLASGHTLSGEYISVIPFTKDENTLWLFGLPANLRHSGP